MIQFLLILSAVFALDVGSKVVVRRMLPLGTEVPLLPFFNLTHIQNTGIAFGLFPDRNWVFIILGSLISILILWMAYQTRTDRVVTSLWAVILGGAWGNQIDRIFYGRVTDFLDFYVGSYHWPAFNVSDSAVCVGAALLIYLNIVRTKTCSPSC